MGRWIWSKHIIYMYEIDKEQIKILRIIKEASQPWLISAKTSTGKARSQFMDCRTCGWGASGRSGIWATAKVLGSNRVTYSSRKPEEWTFKKVIFQFFYVHECFACMRAWCSQRPEGGFGCLGTGARNVCELLCGGYGPSAGQTVLLMAESSLQPVSELSN